MVVDDELDVLKLIKAMVEPLGCEVLTMADSREAARRLESEKFDGVFVDVRMPHLDGFELTRRVRASALNRGAPVVMLTGFDDVETMRQGFRVGATFFLGKPFTRERIHSLFGAVRGALLREKRHHTRLPLRTTVDCTCDQKHFKAGSLNLGESGMLLEPSGGLAVGQEFDLTFEVPEAPARLQVRARAVRKEPPDRIAVEFLAPALEAREAIQRYINAGVKL